ncbi:T9SS type B sorting domain-containing protein [Nonlabens dokdonensis]|nr:T9SS type B sorting domain-containing protein [Nonlabens dokdonensis]
MKRFLTLLLLLLSYYSYSQANINMPLGTNNGNGFRFIGCNNSAFNDSGGNAPYGNNEDNISVFCPSIDTDRMILEFRVVDILAGDVLTIYDGDSTAAPVLATITNSTTPFAFQASATNPTGCLTVRFVSNGSGTATGWRALRSCFNPCQAISTVITTTPATSVDGILRICQGETVTFDGSANFNVDGTGATYEWDLANGNGLNTGQIQTETYTIPGIYQTRFIVTDNTGCRDRDEIDLVIHVSTTPDFTGTEAVDDELCFGDSTDITGVVNTTEFAISPSPPIAGTTYLEDGSGVSYQTCINVDLFPTGQGVASASDLVNIFLNMEHSYLGDLQVTLTSPNGSSVDLHVFSNGGTTNLGNPVTNVDRVPGTGFDYVFNETAAQTWAQAAGGVATIPAGDYLPVDPFSNFIGSPLNGLWCLTVTDNLGIDDGYIFSWGLDFNPAIIPAELSFTPGETSEMWQTNPDITMVNGNTITVTPSVEGRNCYDFQFTDSFGCIYIEQVCINVLAEIPSEIPEDIILCNTTGTTTVDLTQNDSVILNGLPSSDYVITYHNSQSDAENGVGAITNATAFPIVMPPMTVFSAITYTTTNCIVVDSFTVDVIDFNNLTIPDFEQCGAITNFDLVSYVTTALSSGGSGSSSSFTLEFYISLTDAQNQTNPILNPTMFDLSAGTVTIYVRIVSTTDPGCNSINPFNITAGFIPVPTIPPNMVVCDDLSNDGQEIFNLSDQDAIILNGQSGITVTYHLTANDAASGTSPLNAAGYQNISNPQTIYIRLVNNSGLMCDSNTIATFDLVVNRTGIVNPVTDLIACDDVNNGIEQFDLTTQLPDILGSQIPAENTVTFYTSQANADARTNEIINTSMYTAVSTTGAVTIFVRVENINATNCYTTGSFDLIMSATPVANPIADFIVCDDTSNDGFEDFVLGNNDAQILLGQDPSVFVVSYYSSQADADAGNNPLSTTSYTNVASPETIFVRVENTSNTDCYETTSFDIIVNELPRISTAPDISLCDDPSGDGVESFDLTQNDVAVLNGLDPTEYTIEYSNASGVITSPYTNSGSPETITVTVQNNLTTCVNTTTFDIIVNPVPAIITPFTIEECDEDGNGSAAFTLGDLDNQILNGQSGTVITYHDSQADALSDVNPLDTALYENTSAMQTIFYRLEFSGSGCFSIGEFVIDSVGAPLAIVPTPLEACDDGNGNATVDVSQADAEVTAGQTGSTVVYYLNQSDADNEVNGITGDFDYSTNTTLIARVDDDNTDCFSFTTLDLIINPLPAPSLLDQYILCLDENGNLVNGPVTLDTGLNDTDFTFQWSRDGAPIAASTASIDVVEGGDYEVRATRNSTGCENTAITNVRVSSVPDVFDIDITTDPFNKDHQVIVTAEGPDQYWFRLDDGPYVNSGIFNDVSPGPHTVTIAERSGCGEIVVDIFVFGYPDYFTPNADGIHDTWNIIGGDLLPGTKLYIFDRYGKFIKQLSPDGIGWDGTYNGQPLPSSDYWFKIEYAFDGQQREATGHFAMKR